MFTPFIYTKFLTFFFLASLILLKSCSENRKTVNTKKDETSYKSKAISLFDKSTYDLEIRPSIFLKFGGVIKTKITDNPNSVVAEASKAFVAEGKLYVWDSKFHGLKVFAMNGDFLYQIGSVGKGPGEYINIRDVQLRDNSRLVLLCDNSKLQFYDLLGNYQKTIHLGFFASSFAILNSGHFLLYANNNFSDKNKDCNLVLIDSNAKVLQRFFQTQSNEGTTLPSFAYTGFLQQSCTGKYLFSLPYDDKVWYYDKEEFSIAYKFDFGKYKLPDDIMQKISISKKAERQNSCNIGTAFFETDDFTFFTFKNINTIDCAILNRKTNSINTRSHLRKTTDDYLSELLNTPIGISKDTLLIELSAEKILFLKEKRKEYVQLLKRKNESLYNLISNYNNTDNIVILKLVLTKT